MYDEKELVRFIKLRLTEYHNVTILSDMDGPAGLYAIDGNRMAITARHLTIPARTENEDDVAYSGKIVDEIAKTQPRYFAMYCFAGPDVIRFGSVK